MRGHTAIGLPGKPCACITYTTELRLNYHQVLTWPVACPAILVCMRVAILLRMHETSLLCMHVTILLRMRVASLLCMHVTILLCMHVTIVLRMCATILLRMHVTILLCMRVTILLCMRVTSPGSRHRIVSKIL
jgi:hypothetical protein